MLFFMRSVIRNKLNCCIRVQPPLNTFTFQLHLGSRERHRYTSKHFTFVQTRVREGVEAMRCQGISNHGQRILTKLINIYIHSRCAGIDVRTRGFLPKIGGKNALAAPHRVLSVSLGEILQPIVCSFFSRSRKTIFGR